MSRRVPKDEYKYVSVAEAAGGILATVSQNILPYKHGVRVKWELKVSAYFPPEVKDDPKAIVRVGGFSVHSGGEKPKEPKGKA